MYLSATSTSDIISVSNMLKTKADKIIASLVITSVLVVGTVGKIQEHLKEALPEVKAQSSFSYSPSYKPAVLIWPKVGQSAIGASGYGVLEVSGPQKPVPTASIAKLITVLTVLKAKPISVGETGPVLQLSQADVDIYNSYVVQDGSVVAVAVGEKITLYQALQAILLPSANNIADSLAIWAFGSLKDYQLAANELVKSYGLKDTVVGTDASGLSPTTLSTAKDLVKLGEIALQNPIIASIVSQSTASLPVVGIVKNTNIILGKQGINGLKTGNTNEAGGNYLFSAKYSLSGRDINIIGAVLGSTNLAQAMNDSIPLLISVQDNLKLTPIVSAGQTVASYNLPWGPTVAAISKDIVKTLTWNGKVLDKSVLTLNNLSSPLEKGTIVGKLSTSDLQKSTIVIDQPSTKPSTWWRLTHW